MKWYSESWKEKITRLETWHEFFALMPKRIGSQIFWLQTIYRKGKFDDDIEYASWHWEYAEDTLDILRDNKK